MNRKTKIVCTLGPATDGDGILRQMLEEDKLDLILDISTFPTAAMKNTNAAWTP